MKDNKFDIEELVIRYCEGNVSESEKCDVENWMRVDSSYKCNTYVFV